MAKSDVPFRLFFEKYYPEGRLVEHINLSKTHNVQDYAKALNDYFDIMERVTLEDLQSLTEEELNCVPTPWLYDWHHCKVHYFAEGEPEKFIDGIYQKREEYKTIYEKKRCTALRFCVRHKRFTAKKMQEKLGVSFEEFLALAYWLVTRGYVQFENGTYTTVQESKG